MISGQQQLSGIHFDGNQPVGVSATLTLSAAGAILTAHGTEQHYRLRDLWASPRIARAERFVNLPDGGQFQCPDNALLDVVPQAPAEGLIAWLEARVVFAVLGIGAVLAVLLAGYFYGLPRLAEKIAVRIPVETERVIGDQALAWLEQQKWLHPTRMSVNLQTAIRQDFDTLRQGMALESSLRLEFRDAPVLGANALALPGGTIIVTDGLIRLAQSHKEVAAVLAHEIGHVAERHTLRLLLQNSAVVLVAATIVGDAATLGVAGVPAALAQTRYSREYEAAADEFAFALLKQHGISPEYFAVMLERMEKLEHETRTKTLASFLSSHPLTRDRIDRARAAAHAEATD